MTVQMARSRTSNNKGETSSLCSLAPKIVIASITEIAAATIESVRHARPGTSLEEGLGRTGTTGGIPFTAEGRWFRADSTRPRGVRQGVRQSACAYAYRQETLGRVAQISSVCNPAAGKLRVNLCSLCLAV